MQVPLISVVVPTYNREDLLRQTLSDLVRLDWPRYEVIVVDQTERHAPETEALLTALRDRITLLRQARPSVVAAANAGVRAARGELVLFVDDDIRVEDPRLLAAHAANYDDPTVAGVAGRVLDACDPRPGRRNPRAADPLWGFFHTSWDHDERAEVQTAPGANMSFRRAAILAAGGFDERLAGNAFRWENDFCLTLRARGQRVVYDPAPTVLHFYASPGGNENRHLLGRERGSHAWYRAFFHNHVYVTLKHLPRRVLPVLLWRLYRNHVLNRAFVRAGGGFLLARHRAFAEGVAGGVGSWRRWRAEASRVSVG
jgi:GT2 family glycosyltransferase